jgi:threonine synthase
MDVGNPSNFTRIVDLYKYNTDALKKDIAAYSFDDKATAACIQRVYKETGYLMCPHTAVGYLGMEAFLAEKQTEACNAVILATAHPVKFGEVVEPLIGNAVEIPERLQKAMGTDKKSIPMKADFDAFKQWLLG